MARPDRGAARHRDSKDDYLVALYRDADVDVLVSGDSDLLELGAADVTVVRPGELLERL